MKTSLIANANSYKVGVFLYKQVSFEIGRYSHSKIRRGGTDGMALIDQRPLGKELMVDFTCYLRYDNLIGIVFSARGH